MPLAANILHKISLLNGVTGEQADRLLESAKSKRLYAGEVLFTEGSRGNSVYILLQGGLLAKIRFGTSAEKAIATISPGQSFGEIALLTGQERSATMQSVDTSLVLQVTKEAISASGVAALIYQNMAKSLAERLTKMNEKAAKTAGFMETYVGTQDGLQRGTVEYDEYGWAKL